jgi:hypothetical protein
MFAAAVVDLKAVHLCCGIVVCCYCYCFGSVPPIVLDWYVKWRWFFFWPVVFCPIMIGSVVLLFE